MFLLNILINIVSSTIIGIDLGSDTIKVAVGSRTKPVHLVKNLYSNQGTPNIFAYRDVNNWAFGEGAIDLCRVYPESCVRQIPLDNKYYFQGKSIKGYQMMALALTQIVENVKTTENIYDEVKVVIAIPPSMTNREKSYLYCAITIAGINCVQFVTTTYAPIELYVNERKYESNYYNTATFVDIGHQGVRISGFEYTESKIVQKFGEYNDNAGGKTIDENLIKLIINKYKFYLSNEEQTKLLTEVRKAREQLTLYSRISFDFHNTKITLTRKDIEDSCYEIKESLKTMINSLKTNYSSLLLSGSIQLLGGCSRIPCLQEYLRQLLPNIRQLRTMDCNSAVCMGSCYLITAEIPSQIQLHDSLVTSEIILKADGKVYKIFKCSNTESFNPIIRFNNVDPNKLFRIVDNDQDFTTFSIVLPDNQYHSNIYSNIVDIAFSLNYFLMPVPDQQFLIQNNQQIPLKIDYKKIGWEIDSNELESSKVLIKSMASEINQRLNIDRPIQEIEEYKRLIQDQLKKYGLLDWRVSAFAGICRFIDSKSFDVKNDPEKIKLLLNDFKLLIKLILNIDVDTSNSSDDIIKKAKKIKAIDELRSLIEACKTLHAKYDDIAQWLKINILTASIEEIEEQIKILQERGNQAQAFYYGNL